MKKTKKQTSLENNISSRLKERRNAIMRVTESHFQRGIGYFFKEDYSNAYYWCLMAARHHHPEAEWVVGHLLLNGDGCHKDPSKAVQYLTKASKKGVVYAKYELASCYYLGEGVQRDVQTFINLVKAAAKKGVPAAAEALAQAYRDAEGFKKRNYKMAVKWFLVAAEHGLAESMYCLYVRYKLGQGVLQDMKEAVNWLIKAANAGHAVSQRVLGELYYYGDQGLPEDKYLAFDYCLKSAQQGDAEGAYCTALAYLDGVVVEKNEESAKYWLRKAAYQDYTEAQLALSRTLLREKDKIAYKEAVDWLTRGAALGNVDCKKGLQLLTEMREHGISWYTT